MTALGQQLVERYALLENEPQRQRGQGSVNLVHLGRLTRS